MRIVNKSNNPLPRYETEGSSGLDIACYLDNMPTVKVEGDKKTIILLPQESIMIETGIYVEIPNGCEGQLRGRSGLSTKHKLILLNGVGTIDSDYRGEIKVPLMNLSDKPYVFTSGDKIAQLVIKEYTRVIPKSVDVLSTTKRGVGGFGHTGR